ncbi:MAG: hypothetical protein J1F35_03155 [Erysipelotrichales bacterium]|nr:hypothetical protein [Erysipelotrichales bacterium]
MAYKNWNKNLIKQQYDTVIAEYNRTGDKSLLFDIWPLEYLLNSEGEAINFQKHHDEKKQLKDNVTALYNKREYLQYISDFSEYKVSIEKLPKLTVYKLTPSILLSFVHDFYNSMPPIIKSKFNHAFKDRKNNFKLSDIRSDSFFLPYFKYSYINVKSQNTIEDFMNIVHEYGHAISDLINPHLEDLFVYPFGELFPLLMELIACDYIEKHYELTEDVKLYRIYLWNTINHFCQYLMMETNLLSREYLQDFSTNPIEGLAVANKISLEEANKAFNITTNEKLMYSIPFIAAVEFYYLNNRDPELFLCSLIEFLSLPAFSNYIGELEKRQIYLNQHGKDFVKKINADIKKVSIK